MSKPGPKRMAARKARLQTMQVAARLLGVRHPHIFTPKAPTSWQLHLAMAYLDQVQGNPK